MSLKQKEAEKCTFKPQILNKMISPSNRKGILSETVAYKQKKAAISL